ncbi:MAG: hypothetical protein ACKVX7_19115 [Planctomycetota bacterium]
MTPRCARSVALAIFSLAAVGIAAANGCAAFRSPRAASAGYCAVPGLPATYYLFAPQQITTHDIEGRATVTSVPSLSPPFLTAVDSSHGSAVVVSAERWTIIDLTDAGLRHLAWQTPAAPTHLALTDSRLAVLTQNRVGLYELASGQALWGPEVLDAWLAGHELGRLAAVVPHPEMRGALLLICHAKSGWGAAAPAIVTMDFSAGEPRKTQQLQITEFTRLERVTSDGAAIYLAGVHERQQPGIGDQPGQLTQTLLVQRLDSARATLETLVREDLSTYAVAVRVDELAVSYDLAVVIGLGDDLRVYDTSGATNQLRSPLVFSDRLPHSEFSAAPIARTKVLLLDRRSGSTRTIDLSAPAR